jgi:hypothetical protein
MKSAFECFRHAAVCEQKAWASGDERNWRTLLATAKLWHRLGKQSEQMARILGRRQRTTMTSGFAALITEAMKREGIDVNWETSPLAKPDGHAEQSSEGQPWTPNWSSHERARQ